MTGHIKAVLVSPPQGDPFMPPLGIAALAAFLRDRAVEVRLFDLGVEFLDHFLSAPVLLQELAHVQRLFDDIRGIQPSLDSNQLSLLQACAGLLLNGGAVMTDAAWAANALRSEQANDPVLQRRYAQVIAEASKLASMRWVSHAPHAGPWHHLAWDADGADPGILLALFTSRQASPFDRFLADRVPAILSGDPDLVGISVSFQSQMGAAFVLAGLIRRAAPRVRLVLGGSWVSHVRGPLSQAPEILSCFDAVIPFEGELPLWALINSWSHRQDATHVPGVLSAGRGSDGMGLEVPQGSPIHDLPTPCFDGLPLQRYLTPELVLPLASSRGCYWNRCVFCTHYVGQGRGFRRRPSDALVADMVNLERRYGAHHFYLVDEALPPETIHHLPAAVANAGLEVRWAGEARLDHGMLTADPVGMRQSGACLIIFGLESGSQAVLDRMNKGCDLKMARRIIRRLAEAGIPVALFLMTGFPGETFDDWFCTLDFLEETAPWLAHVSVSAFSLTRDSPIARRPARYGIRIRAEDRVRITDKLEFDAAEGFSQSEAKTLAARLAASSVVLRINRESPFVNRQLAFASVPSEGWGLNTRLVPAAAESEALPLYGA